MNDQFILRRADISDNNALLQLRQKTFQETYVEDFSIPFSKNDIDHYFRSSASSENFAKKIVDAKRAIWVIENKTNGELVGYASVGPCDDIPRPDVRPNEDALLNAIYIQRDQRNHGFGQQLMNVVLCWSEEHYSEGSLWLGVWFRNFKAQKFYAHYGFRKVGEFDYPVGEGKLHTFIMKRQTHIS
ncbi:unnamed protein product [Rotaria sordida]|uniref:N-acetyltransferase domain-containing protein n=1 Tax=Rotaria sordida TaxID=392033 RepID=A0A819IVZ4_9BILA|nr:unnamed protein product [Rotaria sordida]CAF3920132.1 unnamed protein product [Rotaria sordida]